MEPRRGECLVGPRAGSDPPKPRHQSHRLIKQTRKLPAIAFADNLQRILRPSGHVMRRLIQKVPFVKDSRWTTIARDRDPEARAGCGPFGGEREKGCRIREVLQHLKGDNGGATVRCDKGGGFTADVHQFRVETGGDAGVDRILGKINAHGRDAGTSANLEELPTAAADLPDRVLLGQLAGHKLELPAFAGVEAQSFVNELVPLLAGCNERFAILQPTLPAPEHLILIAGDVRQPGQFVRHSRVAGRVGAVLFIESDVLQGRGDAGSAGRAGCGVAHRPE